MKRILVATDFSSRSQRALLRAALLAKAGSGVLTIVHVVDDDQPQQIVDREVAAADEFLREQIGSLPELRGADCHPRVVTGDPFEGILGTAGAMAADLIVMGTHRKQLLRDVLVGTTIERVIRTGPCPVLMVNRQADHPYGSVLAPVDMSDASAHALKTADALGFLDGYGQLSRTRSWLPPKASCMSPMPPGNRSRNMSPKSNVRPRRKSAPFSMPTVFSIEDGRATSARVVPLKSFRSRSRR